MGPDSIWFVGLAIGFGTLCGIALWRDRGSATRDPHADRPLAQNKVERIREYRQRTRVGLKEALLAIEAQDRGQPLPEPTQLATRASDAALLELIREGRIIEAIKSYRDQTGSSLAEAKRAIDRLRAEK